MSVATVPLGEFMPTKKSTIDPRKSPDTEFELFSIPAYDTRTPEIVSGKEIGSNKQVLERDDVILSRIVPHIRRAWIVEPSSDRPVIGSSEWIIFRNDRFNSAYLCHALMSDRFHQAFMQTVAGVGGSLLRARPPYVANIEIPLPPIEEQRRIAAVLDAADALRVKRRQALAKLDSLAQAIFFDMFGDARVKTVEIGCVVNSVKKWNPQRDGTGIFIYIDISSVDQTTKVVVKPITIEASKAPSRARQLVAAGDVLVSTVRPNLNAVAYVQPDLDGATASTGFCVLRPRLDELDGRYLYQWVQTTPFIEYLVRFAKGASYPAVSDKIVKATPIPLPPIEEQQRFGRVVDEVETLRMKHRQALAELDSLFASLQQRAFRGEL